MRINIFGDVDGFATRSGSLPTHRDFFLWKIRFDAESMHSTRPWRPHKV
jgi:hypothetical protein